MEILDHFIIVSLIVLSFVSGIKLDNYYHTKAAAETKEALEKQFLRLKVHADADDPVRPYGTPQVYRPIQPLPNTGDFDGDGPIPQSFMDELKSSGKAKTSFRKSDLAK